MSKRAHFRSKFGCAEQAVVALLAHGLCLFESEYMSNAALSPEELTKIIADLNHLAHNLWWTWNQGAQEIFQELSPRCWQNLYHNAVAVLREVSDYELRVRLQDTEFAERVRQVLQDFDAYMTDKDTWGRQNAPALTAASGGLFFR